MSIQRLHSFLESHRVDSVFCSHVSLINPKGKFNFPNGKIDDFWEIICEINADCANSEEEYKQYPNMGVAEMTQAFLPVLADVDIKLDYYEEYDEGDKIITDLHINKVVNIYQTTLKSILNECTEDNLTCFILEKPSYITGSGENQYIKNGFHLHFPYTFLSKTDQEQHLIPRIKKEVDAQTIFADIGFEQSSKLIDSGYLKAPWLVYGNKKDIAMKSYKLTRIIDYHGSEISIEDALANYTIYDSNEDPLELKDFERYYLPRVLSIIPGARKVSEIKSNIVIIGKTAQKYQKDEKKTTYKQLETTEALSKAKVLLDIISDTRAEDRNDWMTIGWALYNIGDGSSEALEIWLDFSRRCGDKFNENECIYQWEHMTKKNMSLGTLIFYAKKDNPEGYAKYLDDIIDKGMNDTLNNCSHHAIARALHIKYGTDFKCASLAQNQWFYFENHRWKKIDSGVDLSRKITEDTPGTIFNKFKLKGIEYATKAITSTDTGEKAMFQVKSKQVQKILSSLGSAPFKKNIMKECSEIFYDEHFYKKLNKNPFIIGFKNGVYDLKKNCFREGMPEDYISLQMPIDYRDFDQKDEKIKEVYDFFEKIFPDKSVRDYFMDISCEVFIGGNRRKHVYFWSGEGDNGKSVTQSIFEKMLGEYAIKLPTSLITGKRTQSAAASPELERLANGVRWAVLQEPDKKDIINIGILKELSGNDTMFVRGLYKDGTEIEPMMKLIVICNDPPQIPHSDKATWNRIRVIPFESTFCDNPPETLEEQIVQKRFPKDPHFDEKIPDMIQALAWVLLAHWKNGTKSPEPEKVKVATSSYRNKNDIYRQFIEDSVTVDEEKTSSVFLKDLYDVFKNWFRESFPNQSVPAKNEVKEYFSKSWGEPLKGGKWIGRKIRQAEQEEEEGVVMREEDFAKPDI